LTGPPPLEPPRPHAHTAPPAPATREAADHPKNHPPAKKAPAKKAAKKAAPAKAAKQAAAKKSVAKKAPAKKAPAKKAAAKKIVPPAPESDGHLAAAAKDAAAHAKSTVEAARNPLPAQVAPASAGRSPVPFVVAIAISVLAVLLVRRLRQQDG
jgi:cobalamin biosynthesis Mg chelatase CobN